VGGDVDRVHLPYFYDLGVALNRVAAWPIIASSDSIEEKTALWQAGQDAYKLVFWLYSPEGGQVKTTNAPRHFERSLTIWGEAIGIIPPQLSSHLQPFDDEALATIRLNLINSVIALQPVLQADLQRMPVYAIPKQGAYDTDDLIEEADKVLPIDVRVKLSFQAVWDVQEAGRCLAFGVATAAGFHMMRAVEDVLRLYCTTVPEMLAKSGQAIVLPTDREPSWGDYTAFLKHSELPDVVLTYALLVSMKRVDRDVIAHPEKVLTPSEAYTLFQKGLAAITSMSERLPIYELEIEGDDTAVPAGVG
jgi:hypothetical protein